MASKIEEWKEVGESPFQVKKKYLFSLFLFFMLLVVSLLLSDLGGAKLATHFSYSISEFTFIPYSILIALFGFFGTYAHNIVNAILTFVFFVRVCGFFYHHGFGGGWIKVFCFLSLFYPTLWYYNLFALRDIMIFAICFLVFSIKKEDVLLFFVLSLCLLVLRAEFVFFIVAASFRFFSKKFIFVASFFVLLVVVSAYGFIIDAFGLKGLDLNSLSDFANARHQRQFKASGATTAFLSYDDRLLTFEVAVLQVAYFFAGGFFLLSSKEFGGPVVFNLYSCLENFFFLILFFVGGVKLKAFRDISAFKVFFILIQFLVIFLMVSNYANLLRLKLPFFGVLVAIVLTNMSVPKIKHCR